MKSKSTWDYIRSQNHILPSPLANKLGVPVFRTVLANIMIHMRRYKNCRPQNDYENELIKNGIVVIPDFLPTEDFEKLKDEFEKTISRSEKVKIVNKN